MTARLDTTPAVIPEAVRRGWLPEDIEGVSSGYALEGNPPPLEGVPNWIDHKIDKRAKAKSGPTALAMAYRKPKAAYTKSR